MNSRLLHISHCPSFPVIINFSHRINRIPSSCIKKHYQSTSLSLSPAQQVNLFIISARVNFKRKLVQLVKLSNKTTWLAWWTKLPTHFSSSNRSFRSSNDIFNCFVTVLNLLLQQRQHRSICWFVQFFFF